MAGRQNPSGAPAPAGSSKPVALITAFTDAALSGILEEIAAGPKPPIADWFIGTYGLNRTTAERIAATPGCQYAPVFCIQPETSKQTRLRRKVSTEIDSHNGFIDARIGAQRPRGYAQFNFRVENARPDRVKDAVQSLHHACNQHGH